MQSIIDEMKSASHVSRQYHNLFSTTSFYVLFNGLFERLNRISFLSVCFLTKYDIQSSNIVAICYGMSKRRKSSKIPTA